MGNNRSQQTVTAKRFGRPGHWLAVLVVAVAVAVVVAVLAGTGSLAVRATAAGRPHVPHVPTAPLPAASTPLPTAAALRPPVSPDPASPGLLVSSGQDQSDPLLYATEGRYFLYTSGQPGPPTINVPVSSSTDFTTWSPFTDALPQLPGWALPGYTWAPDIHRFGSTYVLYFTAAITGSSPTMQCIGVAVGSSPTGPFVPTATPFICPITQGGAIDPRVFTDASGTNWMLWKSDQNIGGASTPTKLWSQPLAADGLSLTGPPALLMSPDEPWQGTIVEAPDMVQVGGTYWVFYSGNWFNEPAYGIGAARCAGPEGPCSDTSTLPLLGSNSQGAGPGEASVFEDPSGVWMLYSPWRSLTPKPDIPARPVFITRLGFLPSGPYLAAGGPPGALDVLRGLRFRSTAA
jgi:hypothetical protein